MMKEAVRSDCKQQPGQVQNGMGLVDGNVGVVVKVTLPCQQNMVGRVIGREGDTIRALQQASQARIVVNQNFPVGAPREVQLSGTKDAVERASNMVQGLLNGSSSSIQSIIMKHGLGETSVFECPKSVVGRVIGKGGETIKSLQRETGVILQIDQTSQPCKIAIAGMRINVQKAIQQLNMLVYYSSFTPNSQISYSANQGVSGQGGSGGVQPLSQCTYTEYDEIQGAVASTTPSSLQQEAWEQGVQLAYPVYTAAYQPQQIQLPINPAYPAFGHPQYAQPIQPVSDPTPTPTLPPKTSSTPYSAQPPPKNCSQAQTGEYSNTSLPTSQNWGYIAQVATQSVEFSPGVQLQQYQPFPHLYLNPHPQPFPQNPTHVNPCPTRQAVGPPNMRQVGVWLEAFDPERNTPYFYNITTGVSQWDKPYEFLF